MKTAPEPISTLRTAAGRTRTAPLGPLADHHSHTLSVALYATALFVGSSLIFVLEPMFGKMLLPVLGGTPAVWITCVLFYQVTLLLGYSYAHWATSHLRLRRQSVLHLLLLASAVLFLPIALPVGWNPPLQHNPIPWVLGISAVAIGLPFTLLCTIAPSLQRWFADLGQPDSHDPYFLYSASNLGSMVGLLAYPLLIEPNLTLKAQSRIWAIAYCMLVALIAGCAFLLWRTQAANLEPAKPAQAATEKVQARQALRWIVLAAVPSSLMLGLTTYLATDIPPVPLLLVVPLAVYLGTFILVFARRQFISHDWLIRRAPFVVLITAATIFLKVTGPLLFLVPLHLITFFVVAMVCHGELVRSRPSTQQMTGFYLCISIGGVLGGVFNAVLAPLLFRNVIEYPLALVAAMLLRPRKRDGQPTSWRDLAWPLGLGAMMIGLIAVCRAAAVPSGRLTNLMVVAPAVLLCLSFSRRSVRFALGLAAIFAAGFYNPFTHILHAERSFFGVYRVTDDPSRRLHLFMHGSTLHGAQSTDPAHRLQMLTYFSPDGPLGQIFSTVYAHDSLPRVGVLGLGAGTLACYGRPQQDYTYYEIDPTVEHIARDPRYFTFLQDCPPKVKVVLGDARLSLAQGPPRQYKLLVLDAFSSDVLPVHLLTRDALRLYLSNVDPHGIIAINISNRYLDLRPVIGNLARDAGLVCLHRENLSLSSEDARAGKMASHWAVLARNAGDLKELFDDSHWKPLIGRAGARVWSDDFSNIFSVIRLN